MNINKFSPVTVFVGLPGSGKSTFAAAITSQVLSLQKKGKNIKVFSNVPILGAFEYNFRQDFGHFEEFKDSIIILDEAGLDACNRNWKDNLDDESLEFLKKIRHANSKLICFSQTWDDFDVKIRDLTGMLYILRRSIIPGFTVSIPVFKKIDVDEETHEFKELYFKDHPILRLFTSVRIFRKKYYKMFDSWDMPTLPSKQFSTYEKGDI